MVHRGKQERVSLTSGRRGPVAISTVRHLLIANWLPARPSEVHDIWGDLLNDAAKGRNAAREPELRYS